MIDLESRDHPGRLCVVALTALDMMDSEIIYSQWFWLSGGKIRRARTIYDPRPFLETGER